MAKKLYPEESVQAIADAIRTKTGKTDKMTVGEMSGEIEGIKSRRTSKDIADAIEARFIDIGWSKVTPPESISQATLISYAQKKQYVRLDVIPNNNSFEKNCNLIAEKIPKSKTNVYAYQYCETANLALTSLPEGVTSIGTSAFQSCPNLALTSLPEGVTSIEAYAFNGCSNLALTSLPEGVTSIGAYAFYRCFNIPRMRYPKSLSSIPTGLFSGCRLAALILPHESVVALADKTGVGAVNTAGTYIYVPSSLVDSYKTATNWTTYASQFRSLEDYTVDGTIDGELDESKI